MLNSLPIHNNAPTGPFSGEPNLSTAFQSEKGPLLSSSAGPYQYPDGHYIIYYLPETKTMQGMRIETWFGSAHY